MITRAVLTVALLCSFQAPPPTPATYRVLSLSETVFQQVSPFHGIRNFHESAMIVQIPPGVPVPNCVHFKGVGNSVSVHVPTQSHVPLGNGCYQLATQWSLVHAPPGIVRVVAEHHAVDLDLIGMAARVP